MSTQTLSNPITLNVNERDIQILSCLSKGLTSRRISKIIWLTPRSVEKIIEKLRDQFDCKNTTELVAFAIRNQIIE